MPKLLQPRTNLAIPRTALVVHDPNLPALVLRWQWVPPRWITRVLSWHPETVIGALYVGAVAMGVASFMPTTLPARAEDPSMTRQFWAERPVLRETEIHICAQLGWAALDRVCDAARAAFKADAAMIARGGR